MKKIVEKSLEAALIKASSELGCSVADLEYEIVQNPSSGFLGFGKKEAIIIVETKAQGELSKHNKPYQSKTSNHSQTQKLDRDEGGYDYASKEKVVSEPCQNWQDRRLDSETKRDLEIAKNLKIDRESKSYSTDLEHCNQYTKASYDNHSSDYPHHQAYTHKSYQTNKFQNLANTQAYDDNIWGEDYTQAHNENKGENRQSKDARSQWGESKYNGEGKYNIDSIQTHTPYKSWDKGVSAQASYVKSGDDEANILEIKSELKALFALLPFEIDRFEVNLEENNTLYVYIDGHDCALLIGERGYRYKALSYLLFNWINPKYGYLLRLEIAEFLKNQEEMIDVYLKDIVRLIKLNGKAQTKTLDGILVYIALTKLREMFPDKYVSVRQNEADEKYIIINDFRR